MTESQKLNGLDGNLALALLETKRDFYANRLAEFEVRRFKSGAQKAEARDDKVRLELLETLIEELPLTQRATKGGR